jgi:hypothetical protein
MNVNTKRNKMIQSRIKNVMDSRGVTIRTLAINSGVAVRTITRARTDAGIAECRLSTLKRIADHLGVGVKDLFEE